MSLTTTKTIHFPRNTIMGLGMSSTIRIILSEYTDTPIIFKRNIVKEYLHIRALSFIYGNEKYRHLIFYGGSCLRHCYNLPRLSEDLDFVDIKKVEIASLGNDLVNFFGRDIGVAPTLKIQKFRAYLKFPILHDLELAKVAESNLLFIKVEVCNQFTCKNYQTEVIPLFKFNASVLARAFDLPTLMATKINAILYRKWKRTDKRTSITVRGKGRDFYDLMWYLKKDVKPNILCVDGISTNDKLKWKLLEAVDNLDIRSVRLDLESLIEDQNYARELGKNIKKILQKEINEKM